MLDNDEISIYGTGQDEAGTNKDEMNDGDESAFWEDNWTRVELNESFNGRPPTNIFHLLFLVM